MLKKIKNYIVATAMIVSFGAPALVPLAVSADCANNIQKSVSQGISAATGDNVQCGQKTTAGASGIANLASQVVTIFSIIVGIVAVLMIIYAGFRYITSGGESGNVSGAKNALIYAIVGLVIVALAQLIVHFVLNTAANAT